MVGFLQFARAHLRLFTIRSLHPMAGPVSEKAPITESSFPQRHTHTHRWGLVLFNFDFESTFETNPKCFSEFCTRVLSERLRVKILAVNKLPLRCRGSTAPKVVWEIWCADPDRKDPRPACGCVVACAFAGTNPRHRQLVTRLSVACTSLSAICHTLSYSCCERCLLITESPKTPGHYRCLIWVLGYIPYTGLAVFSFAISRVPVYTAISIPCEFVFSTLQS